MRPPSKTSKPLAKPSPPEHIRLNKHIADSGLCSRRKADALIAEGRVKVNGRAVSEAGQKINPAKDVIIVDGRHLPEPGRKIYLLFHKPKGVVSTRHDERGRKTIYDCLPADCHKADPAGRLDRESSGALVLSSDGDFINKITHPRYHVEKTYSVTTDKPVSLPHLKKLLSGVLLMPENKQARFESIEHLEKSHYRVVLITGYNRQIRRSLELLGYKIKSLKRTGFGPVSLGNLRAGETRRLTPAEIKALVSYSKTTVKKRPE